MPSYDISHGFCVAVLSGYLLLCCGVWMSSRKPPRHLLPRIFGLLGVAPRWGHLRGCCKGQRQRGAALPPRRSRLGEGGRPNRSQPRRSVSVQDIHCDGSNLTSVELVRNCVESPNSSSFRHWWPSVQHASLLQKFHRSSCWKLFARGPPRGDEQPLHVAAQNGHVAVVEVLLDAGASVDAKDDTFGRGPIVGMENRPFKKGGWGKSLRNRTQGAICEERSWFKDV